MAQTQAYLLFLSLLLLAIANPRAHATFFGPPVQGLSVNGRLCCTQNGNCPGAAVTGAAVTLSCASLFSGTVVVGQNTTDANGFFNITAPVSANAGVILGVSSKLPCLVSVRLPLDAAICPALSTVTGVVDGFLQTTGQMVTQAVGLVQTAQVSFFVLLSLQI